MSRIKKTLQHPKADEEQRSLFQEKIRRYKLLGKPIVYLDESGFALDSPRLHGYSKKGKRCFGKINWHAKGRVNAIGALLGSTLIAVSLYACNVDSDVFLHWVENDLLIHAPPGSVIVLNNATFHKRNDIKTCIVRAGHTLEYLPPYSPDLNNIEKKWAQAKSIRRKTQCSIDELFSMYLS